VGFHAALHDMGGYANTARPTDIDQYTLLHLTGDMVGLLDVLRKLSIRDLREASTC
jgi:hypothetical protein